MSARMAGLAYNAADNVVCVPRETAKILLMKQLLARQTNKLASAQAFAVIKVGERSGDRGNSAVRRSARTNVPVMLSYRVHQKDLCCFPALWVLHNKSG
jgi:hypothetical protein